MNSKKFKAAAATLPVFSIAAKNVRKQQWQPLEVFFFSYFMLWSCEQSSNLPWPCAIPKVLLVWQLAVASWVEQLRYNIWDFIDISWVMNLWMVVVNTSNTERTEVIWRVTMLVKKSAAPWLGKNQSPTSLSVTDLRTNRLWRRWATPPWPLDWSSTGHPLAVDIFTFRMVTWPTFFHFFSMSQNRAMSLPWYARWHSVSHNSKVNSHQILSEPTCSLKAPPITIVVEHFLKFELRNVIDQREIRCDSVLGVGYFMYDLHLGQQYEVVSPCTCTTRGIFVKACLAKQETTTLYWLCFYILALWRKVCRVSR